MSWPVAAAFLSSGRTNFARAVLLTAALLMAPFGLLAHAVAFGAGLVVFGLAFAAPRFAILSVSWGWAVWMLAAPFVTPLLLANTRIVDALPMSWAHRAGIWDYICARIWEQPWVGHGLDAARAIDARIDVRGTDMPAVPLHPHSASLQIWYETGAVGAGLAALALLVGGWSLARGLRSNRPAAAAAAATLAALGLIANVSFGAWQEWWIATLFISAALVSALGAEPVRRA
jgi:O-antigen ligase